MSSEKQLAHVPDILDTISNLSSDEVFTPPNVANALLDLLPASIWSEPDNKFLDPSCKTGVFLREIARRLMIGLEGVFPDEAERREHIFKNMVYGLAITELTGLMSRRSLYYSKDASGKNSVVRFEDKNGNVDYKKTEHKYKNGKCDICGSPEGLLDRGEGMENYAYQFIHEESISEMKFDVIVGNPPYQMQDGGFGASASPIYHLFVNQAFRLKPRYVSMIIPSRWFAGGKGLDSFREQMLASTNFRHLADFPAAADLFPTVEIKGGICYFLWDSTYDGPCTIRTYKGNEVASESERYLGEHGDIFIRHSESLPILHKVQEKSSAFVDVQVQGRKPFGIGTVTTGLSTSPRKGSLKMYGNGGVYFVPESMVSANHEWVGKWKVLTTKGYNGGDQIPHKIMGSPIVAEPGSICSETYIICGLFDDEKSARNFATYMRTRFFRFMLSLRKNTQDVTQSRFKFVPVMDTSEVWTDEKLYEHFDITKDEVAFIESLVKEMIESDGDQ